MDDLARIKSLFIENIYKIDDHVNNLQKIIQEKGEPLEGNCFYEHQTLNFCQELIPKQVNLFWAGYQTQSKICEIGFNAGHSALLFLMANPNLKEFTIFDICSHQYTLPCINYIVSAFPKLLVDLHIGDSTTSMPIFCDKYPQLREIYDLVHVDGGHFEECIKSDMIYADILVKVNGLLIIDDTDNEVINSYVDKYLQTGRYQEINILQTSMYSHRMLKKIKSVQPEENQ